MDTHLLQRRSAWYALAACALAFPLSLAVLGQSSAQGKPSAEVEATPQAVAQAQPAPQRAQAGRQRAVKLGEASFRIPEGYIEGSGDFGNKKNPMITLQALLPDLRPRSEGQGACAPKANACPDFAVIRLRPQRASLESGFTRRYKAAPAAIGLQPAAHGLREVPPHKAQPADGRQFLAQPDGRWVWITCRDFGRPAPKRPVSGACRLAFDAADGLTVSVRFDKKKLSDWSAIYGQAVRLMDELKG